MKRLLLFLVLLGACAPDITQNPPPGPTIVVEFDPAAGVVPTPNDLATQTGKIVVPPSPGDTPAQVEFNKDYLGSLSGFPFESVAQVLVSGPLDPATVSAKSVVAIDVTAMAPVSGLQPIFDGVKNAIDVPPPAGGWRRAHQYAVALISGPGGLAGANGEPVIGSPTWALVSSPSPLVSCQGGACTPTVDVIPSTETDPALRLQDQAAKATQLEKIRASYAPALAQIEKIAGVSDARHIPILWTFSIVDAGEVTFDPASGVIPFPNDVLRSNSKVALPNPATGKPLAPADCAAAAAAMDSTTLLYCGLNSLDGFSTVAPPISENSTTADAVSQAKVDPSRLTAQSVGLIRIASAAPAGVASPLAYAPCLNCLSSPHADGTPQSSPQQLQWQLVRPLDEQTTYLAFVTGDVRDDQGKSVVATPAFALVRSKNAIAVGGKSQVNVLTDAQATQLEPLRAALEPALDGLEAQGIRRTSLALAWAFTTQSEGTVLDQLRGYPSTPALQALPQGPVVFADATAQYAALAGAAGAPVAAIGKFYVGVFVTPVAITGPAGTLDVVHPQPEPVAFVLSVPATPAPPGGYPVTIFGHGFGRDRNDVLGIANTLAAAGQATISSDVLFHGERSSCTGAGAALSQILGMQVSDDTACADPVTMMCNEDPLIGRCVARDDATRIACPGLNLAAGPDPTGTLGCEAAHLGACVTPAGKCEGGDFARDSGGRPIISGWNIFSLTNFFGTRDNLRQAVIDFAQLVHTLAATGSASFASRIHAAGGTATFDLTKVGYVGQSLGGILGTLFNAVSPDTTNVVLNVPGGDLPQIILNAPNFVSYKEALLAGLAALPTPVLPGTPAYDQFIGIIQWILDPADPANLGWRLTHPVTPPGGLSAPNASRKALIQFIEGDQVVPNPENLALVAAAAGTSFLPAMPPGYGCSSPLYCYEFTDDGEGFDATSVPPASRHGFLLKPPATTPQSLALTTKAQTQVATFLATGNLP